MKKIIFFTIIYLTVLNIKAQEKEDFLISTLRIGSFKIVINKNDLEKNKKIFIKVYHDDLYENTHNVIFKNEEIFFIMYDKTNEYNQIVKDVI